MTQASADEAGRRDGSALSAGLGPLPIGPHDHPCPQTMVWSESELRAIKAYAARCVAAERERILSRCQGKTHDGCVYLARCGTVCNKCGQVA